MKKTTSDFNKDFDKYLHSSLRLNRNLNINESSGVEIIELDGSNTSESEDEIRTVQREHAWCYSSMNTERMEDNYNINKKAREKWRMKNKIHPSLPSTGYSSQESRVINSNLACTGSINCVWDIARRDKQPINTLNCFTIVKNDIDDSDSSSDKENSIEITECGDVVLERSQFSYDEGFKRSKCNSRLDSTRTILIYSFKNRSILSDDDNQPFESSEDSTSDSSLENFERVLFDDSNVGKNRIPSPSPAAYIPRLDFFATATLPTVAEVVEPFQVSSENIKPYRSNKTNSLATDRSEENDNEHKEDPFDKRQKFNIHRPISSNNIINWMALSPRNRVKVSEIPNPNEVHHVLKENLISDVQKSKYSANSDDAIISTNISNVQTNIEKHPDVYEAANVGILEDMSIQFSIDEKGDREKIEQLKKPQIRLDKTATSNIITDPIEKLNSDEWIGREDECIDRVDFDIDASQGSNDDMNKPKHSNRCAGDRLLHRNMSLLRPVEWAEYLPITESMPSLHLSLPSDINEGKRSWFKRFLELIQRCIKCK